MVPLSQPLRRPASQTLLIDADDTLWENNIYFERAIASFISFLDHHTYTPMQVREHLKGWPAGKRNIPVRGSRRGCAAATRARNLQALPAQA